ncbi:hypothetical protein ACIPZ8_15050 [Pseudomonas sp. NPDC089422]|uniref:hypothetical protein n=1 Tax=Pseudomonas sp. NPDC089422 TaxID=3364466 RepID=UPI003802E985
MRHSSVPFKIGSSMLICLIGSGCSALWNSEPELARLKIYPSINAQMLAIQSIDGKPADGSTAYSLVPGPHVIEAQAQLTTAADRLTECSKSLSWTTFESGQVYALTEGNWNGQPSLILRSARGEILDYADCSS